MHRACGAHILTLRTPDVFIHEDSGLCMKTLTWGACCLEARLEDYLEVDSRSNTTFKIHFGLGYDINNGKQFQEKTKL